MVAWWKGMEEKRSKLLTPQQNIEQKLSAIDRFETKMLEAIDLCEENLLRILNGNSESKRTDR